MERWNLSYLADKLHQMLVDWGVVFEEGDDYGGARLEATYSPVDRMAFLVLTNVLSKDVKLPEGL